MSKPTIDKILEKFQAWCDSTNREIEYDTSDNMDIDEAKTALRTLIDEAMERNEVWTAVAGYEGYYEVSNLGRVRSIKRMTVGRWEKLKTTPSRTLRGNTMKNGYVRVDLSKDGVVRHEFVHRLVANAFIQNPSSKPCVNHIDSDRSNNQVGNLEWVTYKENTEHGVTNGNIKFPTYDQKNKRLAKEQS